MKWDNTLNLIVILSFGFSPLPARAENLIFQKAIAGDAFQASGRIIALDGIEPPAPSDPNAYAATLYLETLLAQASLDCRTVPGTKRMACKANGADVAGQLVQMGMGRSAGPACGGTGGRAASQARDMARSGHQINLITTGDDRTTSRQGQHRSSS